MMRRANEDLDLDYSERAGFLTGKSAAIADWRHKKDKQQFERQCAVLRTNRWRKKNPARVRENQRKADRKKRDRRHAEFTFLTKGTVLMCAFCGTQWCRIPRPKMGPTPKYCCLEHGRQARYARDMVDAAKRAANVARAVAWQTANRERHREHTREWARRKRSAKGAA
jgi:hypothetical protein